MSGKLTDEELSIALSECLNQPEMIALGKIRTSFGLNQDLAPPLPKDYILLRDEYLRRHLRKKKK